VTYRLAEGVSVRVCENCQTSADIQVENLQGNSARQGEEHYNARHTEHCTVQSTK